LKIIRVSARHAKTSLLLVLSTSLAACNLFAPPLELTHPPGKVSFADQDPGSTVGGTITIERALDETDITFYAIHWGKQDPIPPLGQARSFDAVDLSSDNPAPDGFGAGGGDCVAFDAHEFMVTRIAVDAFPADEDLTFELPMGTEVPKEGEDLAVTFVVHTLYDNGTGTLAGFSEFHNIRECLIRNSVDIDNWVE